MKDRILVLAAHPDDEVLGCGGTLARYSKEGCNVHVAFLADGVYSRTNASADSEKELRRSAASKALAILGVTSFSFSDFPDNRMDTVAGLDVAKVIEGLIETYNPTIVFTHHHGDVNVDHRKVHEATVVACRPQPSRKVHTLLCYEVASSSEWQLPVVGQSFSPNWYVDISDHLTLKLQSLEQYAAELRKWPHPRSSEGVQSLARWRGATVGVTAAEAFELGRRID